MRGWRTTTRATATSSTQPSVCAQKRRSSTSHSPPSVLLLCRLRRCIEHGEAQTMRCAERSWSSPAASPRAEACLVTIRWRACSSLSLLASLCSLRARSSACYSKLLLRMASQIAGSRPRIRPMRSQFDTCTPSACNHAVRLRSTEATRVRQQQTRSVCSHVWP